MPGTPTWPPIGWEIPDAVLQGLPFAALDDGLPLLLLPVRLETRYRLAADPPELRIRIFPDQVHIDADTPTPGPVETELAKEFWRERLAARDELGRQAAWRTFAQRVGTQRAGWLARLLRPKAGPRGALTFPTVEQAAERVPARPVLLPGQWLAVGYSAEGLLFTAAGEPIAEGLRTAPDPAAPPFEVTGSGLVTDEGLAWMFDYDLALEAGMAVTVPLTGDAAAAADGIATLLVVGVDAATDPVEAAAELDRLLAVHARTDGFAFVPQATPTNNTETVQSGWSAQERALADLAARELDPVTPVEHDNAARLASALGLADPAALRRAAFGNDPERERSRAMVRVLFEALMGTFTRHLLRVGTTDGLAPSTVDALREWCTRWVTGGAALPTLAVGPQPYGVLPVRRSTSAQRPASTAEHVQDVVSLLIDEWRRAAATVPAIDPDLIDSLPEGEHESRIASILATQPHPARLFFRWADQFSSLNEIDALFTPQGWFELFQTARDPERNPNFGPPMMQINSLYGQKVRLDGPVESIDDQIAAWQYVYDELPGFLSAQDLSTFTDDAQDLIGVILSLLDGWKLRQDPVSALDLVTFEGILGEVDTQLVEAKMDDTSAEWGEDGVIQAHDAVPGQTAAGYLADLSLRFQDRDDGTLPPSGVDFEGAEPLLHQLLDATLHMVPDTPDENDLVVETLGLLATRTPDELDWLLRESLGLGTHRLDAWATSLATERLNRMRAGRPAGIQVGAFGWVTDLAPRDGDRPSAGFVHAPSMAHAATAAVLRAGWLAHGSAEPLAPAAVDIRSHRVRAARWLLEGVRQGQDLGDLLGYQFERSLHELGADQHIRPVRQQVLRATGRPDVPPDEPVDGIDLLDLDRSGGLGTVPGPVRAALDQLEDAFDATNDVGLFEAVHQLTGANLERATAMLETLATGTQAPPELLAPTIPRASVPVEHRVLVLLREGAPHPGRGWAAAGEREALAPELGAWVASVLPEAGDVGFTAHPLDGAGPRRALTLDDLKLSALDALWLVGDDPEVVPAPLATLAGTPAGGSVTLDPAAPGGARVALREFTVLAVELRRAFDALRVADARDLRPAGAPGEPGSDDSAVLDQVQNLVTAFDRLVDDLSDAVEAGTSQAVAPVVERMARFGLATGRAPGDVAAAAELVQLALRRLRRVAAVKVDAADRGPGLRARVAALFGGRVPLLAGFPLSDGAVDLTTGLAGGPEVDDWLDAAGRARATLGRLVEAGMLSELLDPEAGLLAAAGQSPVQQDELAQLQPGEGWAAMSLPAGTGGRLSVVAVTGPGGPPPPGTRARGLVVDRWSEAIPRTEQVTGVTFQFDAPGNRPAQSWLLAVPPDGEPWSLGLVLDTLLETLEWAALRAVAPEDLLAYGRAIPTVWASGGFIPWPTEEEA